MENIEIKYPKIIHYIVKSMDIILSTKKVTNFHVQ